MTKKEAIHILIDHAACDECGKEGFKYYECPDCGSIVCENCAAQVDGEKCCPHCSDERIKNIMLSAKRIGQGFK